MSKYIDAEKLKKSISQVRDEFINKSKTKGYTTLEYRHKAEGLSLALQHIDSLQQEQPEVDIKSPFTGGEVILLSREEEVTFRGEKIKITRKYYRCIDTGREFTNSKLEEDMMWATFRAYCEKKGITSFKDITLRQEQPEVDLEKEIDKEWAKCNPNDEGMGVETANIHIEAFDMIAHHFFELGKQERRNV